MPPTATDSVAGWRAAARDVIADAASADGLPPLGQDAALAADLGAGFETVAGVLAGLRDAIADASASLAGGENPLAPDGPLARSHGTRYPIAQGPMTRRQRPRRVRRGGGRGRSAAVPRAGADARARGRRAAGAHRASSAMAGRGASACSASSRRAARRAAGGRPPASAPVRADRRRAPGPGQASSRTRASPPTCTCPRRGC